MSIALEELAAEALKLDLDDRAALAEKLLLSLDLVSDAENERLWFDDAERRQAELRIGKVETFSAEKVLAEIAAELG
jgi:hypothetical protein